jgi:flagellar basal-body rod modification protein FlgD
MAINPAATTSAAQPTPTTPATGNTNATTGSAASSNASAAQAAKDAADRFLTLLVTQLKNQDPLNPLDNAQVTTQLAQISTVSGINQLNETITGLAASFTAGQYLQATGLVGHDVVVAGDKMAFDGEKPAHYGLAIAKDVDTLQVTVKDAAGVVVRTIDVGATKSGIHHFDWDGKDATGKTLAAGEYRISVTATAKGEAVAVDPLTIGRVTGIAPTPNGTMVTLGALGTIALTDILEIN